MEGFTGGKYNIVETLSENRAFRVIDMNKHQYFLKRFEPGDVSYDDEKRNLGSVVCPYVPALIESFEDENGRYIVTEWISGISIADHVYNSGPFDVKDTAEIIIKLCEALSFLHWRKEGAMVYLDLKPSNVILRDNGSGMRPFDVCLVDLESARLLTAEEAQSGSGGDREGKGKENAKTRKSLLYRPGSAVRKSVRAERYLFHRSTCRIYAYRPRGLSVRIRFKRICRRIYCRLHRT